MKKIPSERTSLVLKIMTSTKASNLITSYIDDEENFMVKARKLLEIKNMTGFSERQLAVILKSSKTEINRMLMLSKETALTEGIDQAVIKHRTDKYVMVRFQMIKDAKIKRALRGFIIEGRLREHRSFDYYVNLAKAK